MSSKKFEEMSSEERQEVFDKWFTSGQETRLRRLLGKSMVSKALKGDLNYQELLRVHKSAVTVRRDTWKQILSIREETYRRLVE